MKQLKTKLNSCQPYQRLKDNEMKFVLEGDQNLSLDEKCALDTNQPKHEENIEAAKICA